MKCWLIVVLMIVLCSFSISAQDKQVEIPGTDLKIDLVLVEASVFSSTMGQQLKIPAYYIGVYEVTHDQFRVFQDRDFDTDDANQNKYKADAITRPSPPYEDFTKGMGKEGGYPAVSITQQGATRYCQWLYEKTGVFFRLPTEIEWHNACQKGGAKDLENQAWYFENSFEKFHKVGQKAPNNIGLYDMLGNVAEWTSDQYAKEFPLNLKNSIWAQPTERHSRTVKGGSYLSDAKECKCHYRERSDPRWQMRDPQIPQSIWWNTDAPFVGFRVVVPVDQLEKVEVDAYFERAIVD